MPPSIQLSCRTIAKLYSSVQINGVTALNDTVQWTQYEERSIRDAAQDLHYRRRYTRDAIQWVQYKKRIIRNAAQEMQYKIRGARTAVQGTRPKGRSTPDLQDFYKLGSKDIASMLYSTLSLRAACSNIYLTEANA